MTRPDEMREMAEKVFALLEIWKSKPAERTMAIANIEQALRTAYAQGEKAMQERAANLIEANSHRSCGRGMADSIRALEPETEGKP